VNPRFERIVAIDWSGAKGTRHKGIAVAEVRGDDPPRLIRPRNIWSRSEVAGWLVREAAKQPTLFGFDFSFAPPLIDRGAYLPGETGVPTAAREFWAYVDRCAPDPDLGAGSFLERVHRRHFYFGIADGKKADFVHFRQCDQRLNALGGRKTASAYDAIGAAQVAKASFAGMRLLNRIAGKVAIWPMEPLPDMGSAIVEIYTRIYIRNAGFSGAKIRTREDLNLALAALGSPPWHGRAHLSDHQTDALVTAAGMRAHLRNPSSFNPPGLTSQIAQTEGWTFGIV
jgi:ribosome modulation factor